MPPKERPAADAPPAGRNFRLVSSQIAGIRLLVVMSPHDDGEDDDFEALAAALGDVLQRLQLPSDWTVMRGGHTLTAKWQGEDGAQAQFVVRVAQPGSPRDATITVRRPVGDVDLELLFNMTSVTGEALTASRALLEALYKLDCQDA